MHTDRAHHHAGKHGRIGCNVAHPRAGSATRGRHISVRLAHRQSRCRGAWRSVPP